MYTYTWSVVHVLSLSFFLSFGVSTRTKERLLSLCSTRKKKKGNRVGKFQFEQNTELETLVSKERGWQQTKRMSRKCVKYTKFASNCYVSVSWRHEIFFFFCFVSGESSQHKHILKARTIREWVGKKVRVEGEKKKDRFKSMHSIIVKDLLMLRFFYRFSFHFALLCFVFISVCMLFYLVFSFGTKLFFG